MADDMMKRAMQQFDSLFIQPKQWRFFDRWSADDLANLKQQRKLNESRRRKEKNGTEAL